MTDNKELNGLGGWLILVGFGVVIKPILLIVEFIRIYAEPFLHGEDFLLFTSSGAEEYIPYFGTFIITTIIYNAILLIATIFLVYLFFSKHYLFPKIFIAIAICNLLLPPLDNFLTNLILADLAPPEPLFNKDYIRIIIFNTIWITYMRTSKRVKATFVKNSTKIIAQNNTSQYLQ